MLFRTRILITSNFVQQFGDKASPKQNSARGHTLLGEGLTGDLEFSFSGEPQVQARRNRATPQAECHKTMK
jgi:hypothetical protein